MTSAVEVYLVLGRSTLGAARRRLGRVRSGIVSALSPVGAVDTDLARGHPLRLSIGALKAYNAARSAEAGKSIRDGNRVLNFHIALDLVAKLPAGDYAELGTYRGLTASILWPRRAPGTTLYCFDTFAGFDARDLADARLSQPMETKAFRDTNLDIVRQQISGGSDDGLAFRVGFFPETFAGLEDKRFRLVHIDMDLADPITAALETFWPRMVEGGIILVHDYRSERYPMAAEAVDAFFAARGLFAWPLNDRLGTAMIMRQRGMPD